MDDFFSKLLQEILVLVLPMLAVAGVSYAIKTLTGVWTEFKWAQPDAANALEQAARLAVQAAEQAGAAELIDDKKDYALDVAESWLKLRGVKVDLHLLDAAIEAAVFAELNKDREQPKGGAGFVYATGTATSTAGLTDEEADSMFGGKPAE